MRAISENLNTNRECRVDFDLFRDDLEVLIVEDDNADAHLIQRVLSDNSRVGRVVRTSDGIEALDLLESGLVEPDLMIIDLKMPRKDGFSLLLEIGCRKGGRIPAVVLTSSKRSEDAVRSKLRGASVFLTKPDTFEELDAMLTRVVAAI